MYKSGGNKRLDRDSPPHLSNKRSRSSLGRYQDPDSGEDRSPESSRSRTRHYYEGGRDAGGGRGGGGGGGSAGYKDPPPHHSSSNTAPVARPYPYKVLCISSLHSKASDEMVRDTLYREFKRFGDISVKIVNEPDERVAYVYFRSYEDARDAKHSKSRIIIYDKPVMVEAAYESSTSNSNNNNNNNNNAGASYRQPDYPPQDVGGGRYGSAGGGGGGGYSNNRRSPPLYDGGMGGGRGHQRDDGPRGGMGGGYDRGYHPPPHHTPGGGGPPFPPMRHNDYRRENDWGGPPGRQPHMYNNPRYPPGPPPGGMRGAPMNPADRAAFDNKKDKFPNYLHHVSPEDDPLATRTLFAGNLEVNITDEEMRRIFGRYGTVEDIDIKRPPPGTGNAYAFVRFANLDMASRAKTELSGQYIGKFQCKIGYGKVNPTTKIWVGGLGPWCSLSALEREFDRFGSIKKIDWNKGDIQAFITYETIDAAQAAVKDMRGYPLGGPDKRVRTDFAGVEQIVSYAKKYEDYDQGAYESRGSYGSGRRPPRSSSNVVLTGANEEEVGAPTASAHSTDIGTSPSDSESDLKRARNGSLLLASAKSISDVTKKANVGWQGALILKNSSFPAKMYITEGDLDSIEALMKDEEGRNQLRITQRLRLDQSKLDDVTKRMSNSTSHGVFLAMPTSIASPLSPDAQNASPSIQSRPLRNLVSYLKQKEAAGVISLQNQQNRDLSGVLYAFPPCAFSLELLQKSIPSLEEPKEDHLVVVVIRGGTA